MQPETVGCSSDEMLHAQPAMLPSSSRPLADGSFCCRALLNPVGVLGLSTGSTAVATPCRRGPQPQPASEGSRSGRVSIPLQLRYSVPVPRQVRSDVVYYIVVMYAVGIEVAMGPPCIFLG